MPHATMIRQRPKIFTAHPVLSMAWPLLFSAWTALSGGELENWENRVPIESSKLPIEKNMPPNDLRILTMGCSSLFALFGTSAYFKQFTRAKKRPRALNTLLVLSNPFPACPVDPGCLYISTNVPAVSSKPPTAHE